MIQALRTTRPQSPTQITRLLSHKCSTTLFSYHVRKRPDRSRNRNQPPQCVSRPGRAACRGCLQGQHVLLLRKTLSHQKEGDSASWNAVQDPTAQSIVPVCNFTSPSLVYGRWRWYAGKAYNSKENAPQRNGDADRKPQEPRR